MIIERISRYICDFCKRTIVYPATAELENSAMKVEFQITANKDLCPPCLRKAIETARLEIYASDQDWKKLNE